MEHGLGQRFIERLFKMQADKAEGKSADPIELMDEVLSQHVSIESRWVIEEHLNDLDKKEQREEKEEENGSNKYDGIPEPTDSDQD